MTAIFFASFGLAFSGAMMPGPLLTVTISESPRKGFITGPLLILGHAVLEVALVDAAGLDVDAGRGDEVHGELDATQ